MVSSICNEGETEAQNSTVRPPPQDALVTTPTTSTQLVDITRLAQALEQFASDRNWAQFHSPKNLVMALSGEVGELTEVFQWLSEDASKSAARNPETAQAVEDELADVLMYLVRLASVLGVDLDAAAQRKLRLNGEKYPVEKARNTAKKYDQL
jgi:NTP pyrophosphatase (non-canonical NTP hydrolase)